jgi:hypothetical protein
MRLTRPIVSPENQNPEGDAASIRLTMRNYCEDPHDPCITQITCHCRNETRKTGIAGLLPGSRQCEKP